MSPSLSFPRFALTFAAACAAAGACDSALDPTGASGLIIRGDPALVDTVTAPLARVIVDVRRQHPFGRRRVQVAFLHGQVVAPASAGGWVYSVFPVERQHNPGPVIDTTDESGRGEAVLLHGATPGAQFLVVEARALETGRLIAVDSVVVGTNPGQPARILMAPLDTMLFQGSSVAFVVTAADRYGNHRAEAVRLEAGTAGLSVTGNVVRAEAGPGRQLVRARVAAVTDSAWLSIVPRGELATGAAGVFVGESGELVVFDLDGSRFRPALVTAQPGDYGAQPPPLNVRWDPGGSRLVYQRTSSTERLFIGDLEGVARPLIYPSPFSAEFHPDFSPDGAWVYFAARSPGLGTSSLWRVHPDGTGLEPVPFGPDGGESRPAVSPNGQWLAYVSDGFVHVRNLVTGVRTALAVRGTGPRWSPAGDAIAYVDSYDYGGYSGALKIVRPDGTDDRQLVTGAVYEPGIDWTPDGVYLVARTAVPGRLELIAVATGVRIPLPYNRYLLTPAWRPGS